MHVGALPPHVPPARHVLDVAVPVYPALHVSVHVDPYVVPLALIVYSVALGHVPHETTTHQYRQQLSHA